MFENAFPTLLDAAKTHGPNGTTVPVVELLTAQNEFLMDAVWIQGNLPTGHKTVIRTGLPDVYWRLINQGVPPSKSTTAQVTENCAMLEAYSQVDVELLKLYGTNAKNFRLTEDAVFLEAMNQKVAETTFYGSAANQEQFVGFASRYRATSDANGKNILLAGGAGVDLTSIYLIGWGENTCHMIYPQNSAAGFQSEDKGTTVVTQANGSLLEVARTKHQWKCGLVVRDWRYVVRIANVKVGDLLTQANTQALNSPTNIIRLMIRAIDRLPSQTLCKPVFYASREVLSQLRIMAYDRNQQVLSIQNAVNEFGKDIYTLRFMGIPVRCVDALLLNEPAVA